MLTNHLVYTGGKIGRFYPTGRGGYRMPVPDSGFMLRSLEILATFFIFVTENRHSVSLEELYAAQSAQNDNTGPS